MDLITKQNSMYMNLRKKINSRCHLKVFSQGFQNRSYVLEYVGLRMGQSVYTVMVGIYESTYLLVWIWQAVVEGSLVEILDE